VGFIYSYLKTLVEREHLLISTCQTLIYLVRKYTKFCDVVYDCGLIDVPTYCKGDTLDLVSSNEPDMVGNVIVNKEFLILNSEKILQVPSKSYVKAIDVFDYSKTDVARYPFDFYFENCV